MNIMRKDEKLRLLRAWQDIAILEAGFNLHDKKVMILSSKVNQSALEIQILSNNKKYIG